MHQQDLPERWQLKLKIYLEEIESKYSTLSASDFQLDLRLKFGDGSNALFCDAIYLTGIDLDEIAVFTEHCGYHIFPLVDTIIETIDKDGNSIKIEDFTFE